MALLHEYQQDQDANLDNSDIAKIYEEADAEEMTVINVHEHEEHQMLRLETMRTRRTIVMQNTLLCFMV